jgi:hypothetical protein
MKLFIEVSLPEYAKGQTNGRKMDSLMLMPTQQGHHSVYRAHPFCEEFWIVPTAVLHVQLRASSHEVHDPFHHFHLPQLCSSPSLPLAPSSPLPVEKI